MKNKPYVFSFFQECMLFRTKSAFCVLLGLVVYGIILLTIFPVFILWLIYMPKINPSVIQCGILLFGATAIWLVNSSGRMRKWGCVFGLLGQPFWYISSVNSGQWGIFLITTIYTIAWIRGVYFNWIAKKGE